VLPPFVEPPVVFPPFVVPPVVDPSELFFLLFFLDDLLSVLLLSVTPFVFNPPPDILLKASNVFIIPNTFIAVF
jgi:hypothetical protein